MNGGGRKEAVPDVPPMIRMCFWNSLLYFKVGILMNALSMNSDSSKMIYKQEAEGFVDGGVTAAVEKAEAVFDFFFGPA